MTAPTRTRRSLTIRGAIPTHDSSAPAELPLDSDQTAAETPTPGVAVGYINGESPSLRRSKRGTASSPAAAVSEELLGESHNAHGDHGRVVLAEKSSGRVRSKVAAIPTDDSAVPDPFLLLRRLAETYNDLLDVRKGVNNRTAAAERAGVLVAEHLAGTLASLDEAERHAATAMRATFKRAAPDLYRWAQDTPGVGVHGVARLLGATGHPIHAQPYHWQDNTEGETVDGVVPKRLLVADLPFGRTLAQWWAYCGHGDPTRRRRTNMTAEEAMTLGKPLAKSLVHMMAEGTMKQTGGEFIREGVTAARRRSPYRDVYDFYRVRYAEREWTDLHRHNAALRAVGKEILRDIWEMSR